MKWKLGVLAGGMVLATAVVAVGQEQQRRPSTYFECPYVNYFDKECPQVRKLPANHDEGRPDNREVPAPLPGTRERDGAPEAEDGDPRGLDTDNIYPLFPNNSLAPDAPPLLRLLLAEPSLKNARRYVEWYARRTERLREVQALIDLAGREGQ